MHAARKFFSRRSSAQLYSHNKNNSSLATLLLPKSVSSFLYPQPRASADFAAPAAVRQSSFSLGGTSVQDILPANHAALPSTTPPAADPSPTPSPEVEAAAATAVPFAVEIGMLNRHGDFAQLMRRRRAGPPRPYFPAVPDAFATEETVFRGWERTAYVGHTKVEREIRERKIREAQEQLCAKELDEEVEVEEMLAKISPPTGPVSLVRRTMEDEFVPESFADNWINSPPVDSCAEIMARCVLPKILPAPAVVEVSENAKKAFARGLKRLQMPEHMPSTGWNHQFLDAKKEHRINQWLSNVPLGANPDLDPGNSYLL